MVAPKVNTSSDQIHFHVTIVWLSTRAIGPVVLLTHGKIIWYEQTVNFMY